jgi:beta-mannosidase
MWCGNNEILSAWFGWGWKRSNTNKDPKGAEAQWKAYKDIFLNVLNNAVEENDPQRFYWPSSPQTSDTIKSGLTHGDSHYWSVWGGASSPFESYRKNISRFMSEYGFQAFPDLSSIKKYTIEEDWDIYSEVMKSHQRSYVGNKQIAKYMERDYRNPKDFESLLYVGQVLQAEGIRLAMESHRVAMPGNMGSLYWQLNDCWPVASWSGTDYYGKWKALQYFIKKSFEEVIIVPSIDNDNIDIHIVSDRLKSFEGNIKLTLTDFKGIVLWENNIDKKIKANSSNIYFTEPVSELLSSNSYKNAVLTATVYENNKAIASNKFYFKPVKDLELPKVNINFEVLKHEGKYIVKLNTDNLAKNVYLSVEGYDGNYSDNFFDLLPGEEKSVEFESSQSMEEVQNSITIRTIRDTY